MPVQPGIQYGKSECDNSGEKDMNHETTARRTYRRGYSCSRSVYTAFEDINRNSSDSPSPRAEGGKCGAVLAAEKVLKETGTGRIKEFERKFLDRFGSLKCRELMRTSFFCNDFVGTAAAITDELLAAEQSPDHKNVIR